MPLPKMLGSASSFAHLLGLGPRAEADDDKRKEEGNASAARAEDDDDKKRNDESEEDYAKRMEEKKAKKKAEEDKQREEEARRAESEDDDAEMRGNSPDASARRRERERCKTIFAAAFASAAPELRQAVATAGALAFDTTLPRREAVALLSAMPAPSAGKHPSLAQRMRGEQIPEAGHEAETSAPADSSKALAQQIIAAGRKARGEQ